MTSEGISLRQLYEEHRPALRRLISRLVPEAEVDDVLQLALVKASDALGSFRNEADVGTWLHRIARNAALDHLRSRQHRQARVTAALQSIASDEGPAPAAIIEPPVGPRALETREMGGCVREHVDRLGLEQRRVLELKDVEGRTNPEIAALLGVSVATVKIRLHRARAALRRSLSEGCDFYRNEGGNLACDRRSEPAGVSLRQTTSSKGAEPEVGTPRSGPSGDHQTTMNTASSNSSCGCSAAAPSDSLYTAIAAEFVAIGAAIGANCEPCLRFHVREALKVGIPAEDIARAVATAEQVKATPAKNISSLAARLVGGGAEAAAPASACGCAG